MPYVPEKMDSPRIARMLRELEGRDSGQADSGFDAATLPERASGRGQSLLLRAIAVVSAAIFMVLTALQVRAPVSDDKHAAAGAGLAVRPLADAVLVAQTVRDSEPTKAS